MKQTVLLFTCAAVLLFAGGCVTANGNFPAPTAGFTPQYTYNVPRERLWQAILDACDKNQIAVVSADKSSGIIETDWIAGPEKLIITMSQSNRYKYNVSLRDESNGGIKVNIICKIEDSFNSGRGSTQWNDVTPQNRALEKKLEDWFYQQIEDELRAS